MLFLLLTPAVRPRDECPDPHFRAAITQDLEELRELEVAAIEETVFGVSYRINVPLFSAFALLKRLSR